MFRVKTMTALPRRIAGILAVILFLCAPGQARSGTVGLILPRDCALDRDVQDRISRQLESSGIKDVEILMQRPGSDKVSRLNSMRKFLAYGVDVVVIWGGTSVREIAGEAGKTPIVFVGVWDPVKSGIVDDPQRPGGNITGIGGKSSTAFLIDNIVESTGTKVLGVLYRSTIVDSQAQYDDIRTVASGSGLELITVDLEETPGEEVSAALKPADFLYIAQGCEVREGAYEALSALGKPAATQNPGVSGSGVIFTLAPDTEETIIALSDITGRILSGENPGDIPVARIKKINFTINIGEALRLGVKIPFSVLNRGTEVIR